MLRIPQLRLLVGHTPDELTLRVKRLLRCKETPQITVVRRSIDARKKPELYYNYILNVQVKNQDQVYRKCDKKQVLLWEDEPYTFPVSGLKGKVRPVIIGTGPAGLFCGYMLSKAGLCPILLERGAPMDERVRDVEAFWEKGSLKTESNVQFGEGGAGTFSDGKLNTLVKDSHGRNRKVLSIFVEAGAPPEILYDHKPHIGTDVLRKVVVNLRKAIQDMGGEVRFGAKVTDFTYEKLTSKKPYSEMGHITGVVINGKEHLSAEYVVLAPGHSARDTFAMLYEKGIKMEAKPFAVGMRVEHPQELINLSQYGKKEVAALGNAPYKVTAKSSDQRGVYSFCMCPGGYVVNASSEEGYLAVNGMSYSGRSGKNANSAIVVSVTPKDYGSDHPLAGVEFQRSLEKKAFQTAMGKVPVERYGDFKKAVMGVGQEEGKESVISESFSPCVKGAWEFAPVHEILPQPLRRAFVEGMENFGKAIQGFNDRNVLVEGIESRTSSPVRIIRDDSLEASLTGLYPCGEGAGYAGGITSAAMDGIRVAEEVATCIARQEKG